MLKVETMFVAKLAMQSSFLFKRSLIELGETANKTAVDFFFFEVIVFVKSSATDTHFMSLLVRFFSPFPLQCYVNITPIILIQFNKANVLKVDYWITDKLNAYTRGEEVDTEFERIRNFIMTMKTENLSNLKNFIRKCWKTEPIHIHFLNT